MTEMRKLILAGDIGGTKTYIGLFRKKGILLEMVRCAKLVNAGYSGVEEIISSFLKEGEAPEVGTSVFGIACPVISNRCRLTNLDWVVDGTEIRKRFGFDKFKLINDLVATAWGVDLLSERDLQIMNEGEEHKGNMALVAAGTGFGQAHLYWDGFIHRPSPSEGGHGDFAPRNEEEIELLRFLIKRFGHVSYERILSGPGLVNVYDFVKERSGHSTPPGLEKRLASDDAAGVIATEAIEGTDPDCRKALDIFVSIYGAEAGNMALRALAVGGVYVGGGIAPKILKAMEGAFLDSFLDKGRLRDFLEKIPVRVITNEKTALLGAAAAAVDHASGGTDRAERVAEAPIYK